MIGNFILFVSRIWKQTFCIHTYKPDRIGIITGLNSRRVCHKCDKYEGN